MNPNESAGALQDFIRAAGATLSDLTAAQALHLMTAFYQERRADACVSGEEADMLLCHWGTHDWRQGESFQFNLTRQFIEPGDEDEDGMSQLSLTLHYAPSAELRDLEHGNEWCERPAGAADWETRMLGLPACRAVLAQRPERVELDWFPV